MKLLFLLTILIAGCCKVEAQKGTKIYNERYKMFDTSVEVHAMGTMYIKAYRYIDNNGQLKWKYQDTICKVIPAIEYFHKGWDRKKRKTYLYFKLYELNTELMDDETCAKYYLNGKELKFIDIIEDNRFITGYHILSK